MYGYCSMIGYERAGNHRRGPENDVSLKDVKGVPAKKDCVLLMEKSSCVAGLVVWSMPIKEGFVSRTAEASAVPFQDARNPFSREADAMLMVADNVVDILIATKLLNETNYVRSISVETLRREFFCVLRGPDSLITVKTISICVQRLRLTISVSLSIMIRTTQATMSLKFILHDNRVLPQTAAQRWATIKPQGRRRVRKPCTVGGCGRTARKQGFCFIHGEKNLCSMQDCTRNSHQGGLCIGHGGGKRCGVQGCPKSSQSGGNCYAHGGGKRCRSTSCNSAARQEGFCFRHFRLTHESSSLVF